jgi:hypothetical protein
MLGWYQHLQLSSNVYFPSNLRFIYLTTREEHTLWSAWLFTFLRLVIISSVLGLNVCLNTVFFTMFDICYLLRIFKSIKLFDGESQACEFAEVLEYSTLNPLMRTVPPDEPSLILWHGQSNSGKGSQHHWSSSSSRSISSSSDVLSYKIILFVRNYVR